MTNQIIKVGMYSENKTLHTTIINFQIVRKIENKTVIKTLTIQGLQDVSGMTAIYCRIDGSLDVYVSEDQTLEFKFGNTNKIENRNWVTATITPIHDE